MAFLSDMVLFCAQIRPQPNIPCELLDGLHQILRLSDDPQIASSAASAAAALDMLEAALHKIPDPVKNPGLGRHAYESITLPCRL